MKNKMVQVFGRRKNTGNPISRKENEKNIWDDLRFFCFSEDIARNRMD